MTAFHMEPDSMIRRRSAGCKGIMLEDLPLGRLVTESNTVFDTVVKTGSADGKGVPLEGSSLGCLVTEFYHGFCMEFEAVGTNVQYTLAVWQ